MIIINLRNCLGVYRILYVSRNVSNVKREPTLSIWWKQFNFLSKTNSFQEWIFGQAKWACLSYRSLEGGTRVQQIIIGYFCSPNFRNKKTNEQIRDRSVSVSATSSLFGLGTGFGFEIAS